MNRLEDGQQTLVGCAGTFRKLFYFNGTVLHFLSKMRQRKQQHQQVQPLRKRREWDVRATTEQLAERLKKQH